MYSPVLPCIAMYSHVYPYNAMYCHVLPCIAMYCHLLPCIAMYYHVYPCIAMYCHVLPCITMYYHVSPCITMYSHVHKIPFYRREDITGNQSTGHTFEGQCTARLRSLGTAIGRSSKDVIIIFTLCLFSALQS